MAAVFVLSVTQLIGKTAVAHLSRLFSTIPPEALWFGVFACLLTLYAMLSDIRLSGAGLGRILLGLPLRDTARPPVKAGRHTLRGIKIYSRMGTGDVRLDSAASYDESTRITRFIERSD